LKRLRMLAVVSAGYLVAVAVATVVTLLFYLTPMTMLDNGQFGSIYAWWKVFVPAAGIGTVHTFNLGLPGFIAAIVVGERFNWMGWGKYALAGALNAISAHGLMALTMNRDPGELLPLVLASVIGGFAGGAAYWFAAGRFVAARRCPPAVTSPAPSGS